MAEPSDKSPDPSKGKGKSTVKRQAKKTPTEKKPAAKTAKSKPATVKTKASAVKTKTSTVKTKAAKVTKTKPVAPKATKAKTAKAKTTAAKTKKPPVGHLTDPHALPHQPTLSRRSMLGVLGTVITAMGLGKYFMQQQQINPHSFVDNTSNIPETASPDSYITTIAGFQTQLLLSSNSDQITKNSSLIDFPISDCLLTSFLIDSYPQRLLRPSAKSSWLVTAHKDSAHHSRHPLARGGLAFTQMTTDKTGNHLHTQQTVYIGANNKVNLTGAGVGNPAFISDGFANGDQVTGIWDVSSVLKTPWHSYLASEEDIASPFIDDNSQITKLPKNILYGINDNKSTGEDNNWLMSNGRFNHGGWLIEIVFDEQGPTVFKHTAAGRLLRSHICYQVLDDNRIALYSGQKQEQGFLFRFITDRPYQTHASNNNIFHTGELAVATFEKSGQINWLNLKYGENDLDENSGYFSQADVLLYAQQAAIDLGATKIPGIADITTDPSGQLVLVFAEQSAEFTQHHKLFSQLQYGGIVTISAPFIMPTRRNKPQKPATNIWSIIMQTGRKYVQAHYPNPFTKKKDWLSKPKLASANALNTITLIAATDEQQDANGIWTIPQNNQYRYHPQLIARANGDYKFQSSLLNYDQTKLLAVISNDKQRLLLTIENKHK